MGLARVPLALLRRALFEKGILAQKLAQRRGVGDESGALADFFHAEVRGDVAAHALDELALLTTRQRRVRCFRVRDATARFDIRRRARRS